MLPTCAVSAQATEPAISQLRIQVMPEFDDPRVLVIVQGRFNVTDEQLPLTVTLSVPRGAQINQMAVIDVATGATESQAYDVANDPDDPNSSLVTYTLTSAHFFYEYYYDPFVIDGDQKTFDVIITSRYAVDDLGIEIQQPLKASDFQLTPAATIAQFDESLGFNYHTYSIGAFASGDVQTITVSYIKSDPEPSLTRDQLAAMQTGGEGMMEAMGAAPQASSGTRASGNNIAVYIILGIALLMVVGFFGWRLGQNNQGVQHTPASKPKRPLPEAYKPTATSARPDNVNQRYCPQCGTRLKTNARFCHACGQAIDG